MSLVLWPVWGRATDRPWTETARCPRKRKIATDPESHLWVTNCASLCARMPGTCFNQKPIVKCGEKIKKGQVLADGPCCETGKLALGRNVLVAFMPWCGYNFEDAFSSTSRLVKDDVYTSIHHRRNFEAGARDTKLGPREITRDIPMSAKRRLRISATTE